MRFNLKIAGRLATLAASLVVLFAVAAPAHAALTYSGDWNFQHMQNGYCLDSNTAQSVYMGKCNGGGYQLWDVTFRDIGTCIDSTCYSYDEISLKDTATGYCLDSNGTSVYTHACGGDYQWWHVTDGGDTLYQVATKMCLDGSGTSVYIHSCNGGAYQNWQEGAWS